MASSEFIGRVSLIDDNPQLGKGSLNLTAIRESDAGFYECKVIFPNRTPQTRKNGTWFHLTVDSGTLMRIPPLNITVMEGDIAMLPCVMKYPNDSHVTWFKDGKNIIDLPHLWSRANMNLDGNLTIEEANMMDLGHYECVVQKWDGDQQSASAYINVQCEYRIANYLIVIIA